MSFEAFGQVRSQGSQLRTENWSKASYHDQESRGVTLNTEDPSNIPFYQHFGYRVIGQERVSDELQTWAFYRHDAQVI